MNQNKTQKILGILGIVIVTAIITCISTFTITINMFSKTTDLYIKYSKTDENGLDEVISNFRKILDNKYIGEINEEKMVESAIKGYIAGLDDPYSEYLTKEEMQDFKEDTDGEYVGIGVYTTTDTEKNAIVVLRTIGDSPASKAGLLTGDIITKVNDVEYTGEQLSEAVKEMKGIEGTSVKITILRDGQILEFNIIRESIKISHVSSEVLENNIGYIKISSFEGGCAEEFSKKAQEMGDISGLIIDLRFNGGGIVDEALEIADYLVPKDKIMLITTDKNNSEEIRKAKKQPRLNVPVVVLVNEYSASASEILAGILKEDINATLIGTKTYGKGVIQTVYTLYDGSGLKITTNEYFTPNHNKINKIGIEPTIEVNLPEELKYTTNIPKEQDVQLERAIMELQI